MATKSTTRLANSFHRTFKPEREYIYALLRRAARGEGGSVTEISEATGIPTGASSGKVLPTIGYCTGMGLLQSQKKGNEYIFSLTPFGRAVFQEDCHLREPITLWLAHLQLCHPASGADLWYRTFVEGAEILGMDFCCQRLEDYLRTVYTTSKRNPAGPLVTMYTDDASFGKAGVLKLYDENISRTPAPRTFENRRGYAAWLAQLLADFFPKGRNIPINDWEQASGWKSAAGWHPDVAAEVLQDAEDLGILHIDKHMQPWLVDLKCSPSEAWSCVYRDMV